MTEISFIVQQDGKLPIGIRSTLANIIPSYAGRKVHMRIADAKDKRSLDQNSYYRAVVLPHVRRVRFDMGDALSLDAVHEDLLTQFAPTKPGKAMDGKAYTRPMRTREMSKEEMANFITAITAMMVDFEPVPEAL